MDDKCIFRLDEKETANNSKLWYIIKYITQIHKKYSHEI